MRGYPVAALRACAMGGSSLAAVALLSTAAAAAQPATRAFDLPEQDAAQGVSAFAQQADIQIIIPAAAIRGHRTNAVRGTLPIAEALRRLLDGTGLSAVPAPNGAAGLIIRAAAAPQASAQEEPASSADIVVTAQKRSERIQDVPIAISAFTQETLDKQKIEAGPDLLKAVPNITFSKNNFASYNLEIRGVGTKAVSVTTDPGVAINFNSSTLITNRFFEQEFFDIERIEVLRGPQGTLYGRNATGGVVNIISNKADLTKFDGYLKAEVGNFGSRRAQGAINVPIISDVLGLRLAGAYTKRDGFTTNDITMNRVDERDLYTTRATLGVAPSSTLRADLIWERFSEDDNRARTAKQLCHRDDGPADFGAIRNLSAQARGFLSQGCKPGSLYDDAAYGVPNGLSLPYVQIGADDLGDIGNNRTLLQRGVDPYAGTTQTRDLRRISSIKDPIYRATTNVYELNVNLDVSDSLMLTSQSALNRDRYYSNQDYNRFNTRPIFNSTEPDSELPYIPGGYYNDPQLGPSNRLVIQDLVTARSKQFSQELRLSTTGAGTLQGTIGGNYTYYKNQTDYYVFINTLTAFAQGPSFVGNNSLDLLSCNNPLIRFMNLPPQATTSAAAAEAGCVYIDPNPLERINGQGHNYFRSSNRFRLNSFGAFVDGTYALNRNLKLIAGLRYNDDVKVTTPVPSQLLLAKGILAGTVSYGYPTNPDIRQHFTAVTGRAGVQWTPKVSFTDDTMIYLTYSRGYKAGGTNPPPIGFDKLYIQTLSFPATFKPEYINSLELGAKNTLFGDRLTLNLTGYFYDFSNYQVSQIIDRQAINENYDTKMYGLEGELLFKPNRAITLNANFGLQGSRLRKNQYSIDVMDRLQGHGDEYALVKPFVQIPSNCVVRRSVIEQQILANRGGDPNADNTYDYVGLISICPGSGFSGVYPADSFPNQGRGFYANVGGNEVPNAPHFTVNLGAEYNIPFAGDWVLTPRADFYHQSGSYARVYNTSIDRLRGWENTNISIRAGNPEIGLLIEAYVKNLFNDDPITDAFINSDDTGLTTNVFTFDPRIIGINVTKKF